MDMSDKDPSDKDPSETGRSANLVAGLRRLAVVMLSASIVAVTSERVFWFWAPDPRWHWEAAIAYSVGMGPVLWTIGRYRVGSLWSLLLVSPLLAYLIEGVITPILYEGGPFVPFFPAWFSFWHGILGVVVAWYLMRRWLLASRWRPLLGTSVALGIFWACWSTTLWLPEAAEDRALDQPSGELAPILGPLDFAWYALAFTLILAGSHWLLGYVWVERFEPRRVTRWLFVVAVGAMLVTWTVFVPWALPMFAAYVALQLWGLRRHRDAAIGPDLLHQLAGRVPLRRLWPLAGIPAVAAPTYALLWEAQPSDELIRGLVFYGTITAQTIIGFVVTAMALIRAFRSAPALRAAHGHSPAFVPDGG